MIFVEPKIAANIGSLARVMKNFGLSELAVIKPACTPFAGDAYKRAMHGIDVLEKMKVFESVKSAVQRLKIDFLVGTSAITTPSEKYYLRISKSPREFTEAIKNYNGSVGILFGREDFGLNKNELAMCDMLVTIPAYPQYPVLNISHAAAIIFYELWLAHYIPKKPSPAVEFEKEKLFELFSALLNSIGYPEHKKENTSIMFRRLIGRAVLTKWEYHILMGILKRCVRAIKI